MLWDTELWGNYFWGSASGTPWLTCSMLRACYAEIGIPSGFCFPEGIWLVEVQGWDTNRRQEKGELKMAQCEPDFSPILKTSERGFSGFSLALVKKKIM